MVRKLTKKQRYINRTLALYFKEHGINHNVIAERLGYSSRHVVDNQLSYGIFRRKRAAKWAAGFGFSEEFLMFGKGQLIPKQPM